LNKLSHIDKEGKARMVDISDKSGSVRIAKAYAEVFVSDEVFKRINENNIAKGDVLATARLAGIQAAKKTAELIPLCHNILINEVMVDFILNNEKKSVEINTAVKTTSKTGVEMEALTAASVSALTVYDMCKAIDKSIEISNVKLLTKTGGKSGNYKRKD
jgi:cyclic pyranopterin phosphate synthase